MPSNVSFFQEILNAVAEQGRQLLPASLLRSSAPKDDVVALTRALVSSRGEASGVAIARQLLDRYRALDAGGRQTFFRFLADELKPDQEAVVAAATSFIAEPGEQALTRLQTAVESPRQEFFRRLNLAPGATAEIVAMRRELLRLPGNDPALAAVDQDLRHLLASWFNRGFLVLRRIDWQTPAVILEKIIAYEAVHAIQGWDDLRRRLEPADRRCFAFFHPSLVDEPLIFVEVALVNEIPAAIQPLLTLEAPDRSSGDKPSVAVFYSISNCQDGLRGISFGNFLIKQVVEELAKEQPQLKTFVTLSPAPMFARWLDRAVADERSGIVSEPDRVALQLLRDPAWIEEAEEEESLRPVLMALAAYYFLSAKSRDSRPVDPVARFHLGNGARLERINWLADMSDKGQREAHGIMVNYRYDLKEIEKNHEAFVNDGVVAASRLVRSLLRAPEKSKAVVVSTGS
jgi:malonyl-CoA decarboxylase